MGFEVMSLTVGFLPHTHTGKLLGQVQGSAKDLKQVFTILSSSEWNAITQKRPPGLSRDEMSLSAFSSGLSSSFTAILSA